MQHKQITTTENLSQFESITRQIRALEFAQSKAKNPYPIAAKIRHLKNKLIEVAHQQEWNNYLAR